MLILSRRVGETIIINDDILATILSIKGNQVRIGIEAPKGVEIHREEIWERIQEEKKSKSTILHAELKQQLESGWENENVKQEDNHE